MRVPTSAYNLAKIRPDLAEEWHLEKNVESPEEFAPNSNRKVWWRCIRGHEWEAPIYNRSRGSGCRACTGRVATNDRNLASEYPMLALECSILKFGITNNDPNLRLAQQRKGSKAEHTFVVPPFFFENGKDAANLEQAIKEEFKCLLKPEFPVTFDGCTETLPISHLKTVLKFIELRRG